MTGGPDRQTGGHDIVYMFVELRSIAVADVIATASVRGMLDRSIPFSVLIRLRAEAWESDWNRLVSPLVKGGRQSVHCLSRL